MDASGRQVYLRILLFRTRATLPFVLCALLVAGRSAAPVLEAQTRPGAIPRTADGKPNLQGIWKAAGGAAADLTKGVVEGGEIPYQPCGREEAGRELRDAGHRRPARELLPARRAPHHVHGAPVSDLPDERAVAMTFEWSLVHPTIYTNGSKPAGRHRVLDGRLARPLGRRHARRRRHQPQRPHLVRHVGQLSQRGAAARRALHDARRRHDRVRGHDHGSKGVHTAMDDQHALLPAHRHAADCSSITARRRRKRPTATSSAIRARGIPNDPHVASSSRRGERARSSRHAVCAFDASCAATTRTQACGTNPAHGRRQARTCRGTFRRTAAAPTTASRIDMPTGLHARRTRRHRRSAGREAAAAAVGRRRDDRRAPRPERGYDDPTAHCFVSAGVPRSMYTPSPMQIVQTPGYVVICSNACRGGRIPLGTRRPHSRQRPAVARRLGRPLGRRHAGGGDDELQREDVARRVRRHHQPRRAGGRALHPGGCGHHLRTGRR